MILEAVLQNGDGTATSVVVILPNKDTSEKRSDRFKDVSGSDDDLGKAVYYIFMYI